MIKEKSEDGYIQFKKYFNKADYVKASALLKENPEVKNYCSREELIEITSFYEKIVESMINEKINNIKKKINEIPSKLEKRVNRFREDFSEIVDDSFKEI
ncbi:hypothetical protein M0R19_02925 [Candidatus Pacearchaeota archaeon]|jgi:hypothetical protein|nr:hypothetical protein [Candidatus Pacearchaeota archaeon]